MAEIKPTWLDTLSYAAKFVRQYARDILTEGIVASGDLAVTEKATPDMSVDVAAGSAYVQGDQAATQGHYRIYNDATVNKTIAASDPTNPRKDRVVAQVKDSTDISGTLNEWEIQVLTGTPAASPVVPSLPSDALDLAIVDVAAGATTITNANITDQRSQITNQNIIIDADMVDTKHASDLVQIAGVQTITGKKTFSDDIVFSGDKIIQTNVKARAYLSATQVDLVDNTYTKILLDTESYDVGSDFASNKFTAPVTGYYSVNALITFTSVVADKQHTGAIYINGTLNRYFYFHSSNASNISGAFSDVIYLTAADYVELYGRHISGVNTVDVSGGAEHTFMTIHLLSV